MSILIQACPRCHRLSPFSTCHFSGLSAYDQVLVMRLSSLMIELPWNQNRLNQVRCIRNGQLGIRKLMGKNHTVSFQELVVNTLLISKLEPSRPPYWLCLKRAMCSASWQALFSTSTSSTLKLSLHAPSPRPEPPQLRAGRCENDPSPRPCIFQVGKAWGIGGPIERRNGYKKHSGYPSIFYISECAEVFRDYLVHV